MILDNIVERMLVVANLQFLIIRLLCLFSSCSYLNKELFFSLLDFLMTADSKRNLVMLNCYACILG